MGKVKHRMNAEDRREAIIAKATPLFARRGFHGVRFKDIAKAASISEALVCRHFPDKEALFEAIQDSGCSRPDDIFEFANSLPRSTESLVTVTYLIARTIVMDEGVQPGHEENIVRLIGHSLLEDGQFAKNIVSNKINKWIDVLSKHLDAAIKSGDVSPGTANTRSLIWICHHLIISICMFNLPKKKPVEYGMNREEMLEHTLLVIFRGVGMKPAVIEKYYDSKKLKEIAKQNLSDVQSHNHDRNTK